MSSFGLSVFAEDEVYYPEVEDLQADVRAASRWTSQRACIECGAFRETDAARLIGELCEGIRRNQSFGANIRNGDRSSEPVLCGNMSIGPPTNMLPVDVG
jgi:hypothetical protein